MANLALFLTINTVIGSSFLFIDEIDAHLDNDNLGRLASSLQKYSEKN